MNTHYLKTLPEFFQAVSSGKKRFEIRKDDRGFMVGDTLLLQEFDGTHFTGQIVRCVVTYRTTYEQKPGFVVLGIEGSEA